MALLSATQIHSGSAPVFHKENGCASLLVEVSRPRVASPLDVVSLARVSPPCVLQGVSGKDLLETLDPISTVNIKQIGDPSIEPVVGGFFSVYLCMFLIVLPVRWMDLAF